MPNQRSFGRGLIVAAAASAGWLASVPAFAQPQATPECVAGVGRVSLSYAGVWPTACVPRNPTVQIAQGVITMHAKAVGELCAQVITSYTVTGAAPQVCDGLWPTRIVIHRNDGSVAETIDGPSVRVDCSVADFNDDCAVSVQDIFDFLAAYFSGNSRADVNHAGGVTVQDVFDYLAAYFSAA